MKVTQRFHLYALLYNGHLGLFQLSGAEKCPLYGGLLYRIVGLELDYIQILLAEIYRLIYNFVNFHSIHIISSAYQRACRALHFR
jgi:hypothetical protein